MPKESLSENGDEMDWVCSEEDSTFCHYEWCPNPNASNLKKVGVWHSYHGTTMTLLLFTDNVSHEGWEQKLGPTHRCFCFAPV